MKPTTEYMNRRQYVKKVKVSKLTKKYKEEVEKNKRKT